MQQQSIDQRIRELLAENFELPVTEITDEMPLEHHLMDPSTIDALESICAIEEEFDIQIRTGSFDYDARSVGELIGTAQKLVEEKNKVKRPKRPRPRIEDIMR